MDSNFRWGTVRSSKHNVHGTFRTDVSGTRACACDRLAETAGRLRAGFRQGEAARGAREEVAELGAIEVATSFFRVAIAMLATSPGVCVHDPKGLYDTSPDE